MGAAHLHYRELNRCHHRPCSKGDSWRLSRSSHHWFPVARYAYVCCGPHASVRWMLRWPPRIRTCAEARSLEFLMGSGHINRERSDALAQLFHVANMQDSEGPLDEAMTSVRESCSAGDLTLERL